jgi:Spy/CpxP family protein refolding chaperone
MITLRRLLPAIVLAASFAPASYADTPATGTTSAADSQTATAWHGGHHRHRGGFARVLRQLDLSANEKTLIRSIYVQAKPQVQSLRAARTANRALMASTPPTDSGYPALVQTAEQNARNAVQLRSQLWSQFYRALTPEHQNQIPGILAAQQNARKAWKAQHAPS